MTKKVFLILISIWWGWTVLIDFTVIPTTFSIINDFFNAGELGIALFSRLNFLEVILSTLLIILGLVQVRFLKKINFQFTLIIFLWIITLAYFSYLIPKISELTTLWKKAEGLNQLGISGIIDIQQEHQFFHRAYIYLDVIKLLILSTLIGLELVSGDKNLAKTQTH